MKENVTTNILFAGVGGQGIVLASSLLASVCLAAGHDVKQSEVHGMAQRGGSVTSHVRFGDTVYSPTIARGEADFLVGFELLESVRWLDHLAPSGATFVNTQRIHPITVASGTMAYPEDLAARVQSRCADAVLMSAWDLAQEAGSTRAVNMVMLGALSTRLPFAVDAWQEGIAQRVPPKTLETNWAAFLAGRGA